MSNLRNLLQNYDYTEVLNWNDRETSVEMLTRLIEDECCPCCSIKRKTLLFQSKQEP